jgi:hypothetical protein
LVAGHRRLVAAKAAGLTEVPVVITEFVETETDRTVIQYHENVEREDLTAWEEAQATLLLTVEGLDQKEVAVELGISGREVARRVKVGRTFAEDIDVEQLKGLTHEALFDLADEDMPVEVLVQALENIVGGESTRWGIQAATREAQAAQRVEATAKLIVLAREDGAVFADEQPKRGEQIVVHLPGGPSFSNNLGWERLTVELHRIEDCHVYYIQPTYTGDVLTEWCKSPARHREKGKSELKEADAETKATMMADERAARKEVKEAKLDRQATVASVLHGHAWKQGDVLSELVPAVVTMGHDTCRIIAKALDLEIVPSKFGGDTPDYFKMVEVWLDTLPATKRQWARIVAVAAVDYIERTPYASSDKAAHAWFDEHVKE